MNRAARHCATASALELPDPDRRDDDMAREAQTIRVAAQTDVRAVAGVHGGRERHSCRKRRDAGGRSAEPTATGLAFWSSAQLARFR